MPAAMPCESLCVMSAEDNGTGRLGGVTGKGFLPGQTGNPGGQPAWVKRARDAMRDELYPAAQAHLLRVLTGRKPANARPEDDDLYGTVTVDDRNTAAKMVLDYALPKPKAQVALKHGGKGDTVVVEVKTYSPEDKSNG